MFKPIYILVCTLRGTNRREGETTMGKTRQLQVLEVAFEDNET
jgi:hypothetical protein